jgi:hypothetical protein
MHQDRARLEHADRLGAAAIDQRRDLGIGIGGNEARAELLAIADLDQPGVVFRALVPERQQLLEHDGDLLAVRRAQRIELERMLADRQLLVVRRARDRAIGVGEAAAVGLVPGPDFGWRIGRSVAHFTNPLEGYTIGTTSSVA